MVQNIYCVFDKVAGDSVIFTCSPTDGAFIRQNKDLMGRMNGNYLNDYECYCLGTFDSITFEVVPAEKRTVSWDSYLKPEIPLSSSAN